MLDRSPLLSCSLVAGVALGMVCAGLLASRVGADERQAPSHASYPTAPTSDTVDHYGGVEVADPYRPLEDLDAPATRAWIDAENQVTAAFFEKIPERDAIHARLTELWDFARFGAPFQRGARYFFEKNDGLQNQSVLYVTEDLGARPRVLLDPNTLSADGTVALATYAVSEDGRLLAYALQSAGSDWETWHLRDVGTGEDLADVIRWSKFSGASWKRDGSGFYYSGYEAPREGEELEQANYFQKLYFHRIGTPQSADRVVYERPDHKEWLFDGSVTEDGRYLVVTIFQGTDPRTRVYYRDLTAPQSPVVPLLDDFDAEYVFLGNDGSRFWFRTNLDAPRGRIVAIDTAHPEHAAWRELVAEGEDALQGVAVVGDRFIAQYLHDAHSVVRVFALDGTPAGEIPLPAIGSVGGFTGERKQKETFYRFTSFTTPGEIYRYDVANGESSLLWRPQLGFDPSRYETRQVFYRSKDGTRVPMFLSFKKGLAPGTSHPTLLYGYGGFDISITPAFKVDNLVWMEMGGVYAVANLRGGGEYGEAWHQAGTKLEKQNVFDDFIAAAEWLVANHWTSKEKLAIAGRSNGGLLIGAVLDQRPDLFGAAVPGVGVMDMLRFNKFTIGWAWESDYGSPQNPQEFKALYAYSPYHNIRRGVDYPPTLVLTADHDDRVFPGHSFKYAARLQAAQAGPAPILIRIETRAGHGGGKPTSKLIDEATDVLSFLVEELGFEPDLAKPQAAPGRSETGQRSSG